MPSLLPEGDSGLSGDSAVTEAVSRRRTRPGGGKTGRAGPGGGAVPALPRQPVTCSGRGPPRAGAARPAPFPSPAGGGTEGTRRLLSMEAGAGAEAEPLLPPQSWRTRRGLWRTGGGARSAAEDGGCREAGGRAGGGGGRAPGPSPRR